MSPLFTFPVIINGTHDYALNNPDFYCNFIHLCFIYHAARPTEARTGDWLVLRGGQHGSGLRQHHGPRRNPHPQGV